MAAEQRFQASYLHALVKRLFMAAGAPGHIAEVIAEILINANLAGHDSHGVLHVSTYLSAIDSGRMDPAAEPSAVKETDRTLSVDFTRDREASDGAEGVSGHRIGLDLGSLDPWYSFHPAIGWQSFGGMVVFV